MGEYVHELVRALVRDRRRGRAWRSSPRHGRTGLRPRLAVDLPGARMVDRKLPVRLLTGRGIGWPGRPSSGSPGEFDVVHAADAGRHPQPVGGRGPHHSRSPLPAAPGADGGRDAPRLPEPGPRARPPRAGHRRLLRLHRRRRHRTLERAGRAHPPLPSRGAGRGPHAVATRRRTEPREHILFLGTLESAQERRRPAGGLPADFGRGCPTRRAWCWPGGVPASAAAWQVRRRRRRISPAMSQLTGYVAAGATDGPVCPGAHAGAAVARRRLRPARARGDGVRRAGGGVVRRLAARSRGRRRRRRLLPTTSTASPRPMARAARVRRGPRRRRPRPGARRRLQLGHAAPRDVRHAYAAAVEHRPCRSPWTRASSAASRPASAGTLASC